MRYRLSFAKRHLVKQSSAAINFTTEGGANGSFAAYASPSRASEAVAGPGAGANALVQPRLASNP